MKLSTSLFLCIMAVSANALSKAEDCEYPATFFDARKYWHQCPTISEIRDRGDCDASWAFAAVETMSDRTCIKSAGKNMTRYSAEDVLSCCDSTTCASTSRCSGGYAQDAWIYWVIYGVVSEDCKPYNTNEEPTCQETCRKGYPLSYEEDKTHGSSYYAPPNDTLLIQLEIMKKGPVTTTIRISDDFANYKDGVYRCTSKVAVGYESARIIGWDSRPSEPYWILASSRGYDWGDKGIFLVARERNECGVESSATAGTPNV